MYGGFRLPCRQQWAWNFFYVALWCLFFLKLLMRRTRWWAVGFDFWVGPFILYICVVVTGYTPEDAGGGVPSWSGSVNAILEAIQQARPFCGGGRFFI